MSTLEKLPRMPARAFLYGFLGFIAVAGAVTMFSDPLDPEIGNTSSNPSDWSDSKLKLYLSDNDVVFGGEDGRSQLVKLVKRHMKAQERARQTETDPLLPPDAEPLAGKQSTVAGADEDMGSSSAQAANERLMKASNLA